MLYTSTRQKLEGITPTRAILQGISEEGGLFVPCEMPKIDFSLEELCQWSYQEIAYHVMRLFFDEIKEEDLKYCIQQAYDEKFDDKKIAPLIHTTSHHLLELFHGPTIAFKDMALSILPYLMLTSKKYSGETKEIVILTATSGDTGKAALEGFANVKGTKIIVFFPQEGVSQVQRKQMVTTVGDNTFVIGVKGNFDDCQSKVKEMFADKEFAKQLADKNYQFSSANSINIGRLIPQVAYYFAGYSQMVNDAKIKVGEAMNVVVPTGNFGNILAAYYAKCMGLPIKTLICASNRNKVLFDFLQTGVYNRNRPFYLTESPSMDILISSNLERLLYHMAGNDEAVVKDLMKRLKEEGKYEITETMKNSLGDFYGGYADDEKTKATIKRVYEQENYLMDTHTAVACSVYDEYVKATGDLVPSMIVSTASPYKFTHSVMTALDKSYDPIDDFTLLQQMNNLTQIAIPKAVEGIEKKEVLHDTVCEVDEIKKVISQILI